MQINKIRHHLNSGGIYNLDQLFGVNPQVLIETSVFDHPLIRPSVVRSSGVNQTVAFVESLIEEYAEEKAIDSDYLRQTLVKTEAKNRLIPLVDAAEKLKQEWEQQLDQTEKSRITTTAVGWYETGFTDSQGHIKIKKGENGILTISSGFSDFGQNLIPGMKMVAANILRINPDQIQIENSNARHAHDTAASATLWIFAKTLDDLAILIRRKHLLGNSESLLPYMDDGFHSWGEKYIDYDDHLDWNRMAYISTVVDLGLDPDTGRIYVHRVYAFVDAGNVIDQNEATSQVKSGIVQTIGDALLKTPGLDKFSYPDHLFGYYSAIPGVDLVPDITVTFLNSENLVFPIGVGEIGVMSIYQCLLTGFRKIYRYYTGQKLPNNISFPLNDERVWSLLTKR